MTGLPYAGHQVYQGQGQGEQVPYQHVASQLQGQQIPGQLVYSQHFPVQQTSAQPFYGSQVPGQQTSTQGYSQQMQYQQVPGQHAVAPQLHNQGYDQQSVNQQGYGQQALVQQMPWQQPAAALPVVGSQYCAQGEQLFFLNENFASLSGDDFTVLDGNKQPVFKMDSSAFSMRRKRVLKAVKGNQSVCSMKRKVYSESVRLQIYTLGIVTAALQRHNLLVDLFHNVYCS